RPLHRTGERGRSGALGAPWAGHRAGPPAAVLADRGDHRDGQPPGEHARPARRRQRHGRAAGARAAGGPRRGRGDRPGRAGARGGAIARSADVRYRHAFLGALATRLIGGRASIVLTGTGGVRSGLSLLAGWIGLSITVAEVTNTPRGIWAGLLLVAVVLMLTR